jgi:hypothetical protein
MGSKRNCPRSPCWKAEACPACPVTKAKTRRATLLRRRREDRPAGDGESICRWRRARHAPGAQEIDELHQCHPHRANRKPLNAFGSGDLILEKAVINPRHVEVQVFGDSSTAT